MWLPATRTCGRTASWVRGARVRLVAGLSDVTSAYTTRERISRIICAQDLATCTTVPAAARLRAAAALPQPSRSWGLFRATLCAHRARRGGAQGFTLVALAVGARAASRNARGRAVRIIAAEERVGRRINSVGRKRVPSLKN